MNIFIDNNDLEEQYGEQKYKEYLEKENKQMKQDITTMNKEIKRLNKCIDEALEIIIKDWNDKCTIPIHSVVDTGNDIRIKLYYHLFLKGVDKE